MTGVGDDPPADDAAAVDIDDRKDRTAPEMGEHVISFR